ncbi:MAG TPA: VWD domain-containing protein [Thermoanaerobaculia bacterium]|nr:VWD domain-containing protein [Thermoanaerobaculia bacterium]
MRSCVRYAFVFVLLSVTAIAATPPTAAPSSQERRKLANWRRAVAKALPRLKKAGCFTIAYPSTDWREMECRTPPNRPYLPRSPHVVGNGTDYSAVVTSGLISTSEGSFDSMNVTSENDGGTTNTYSLQLNSSLFSGSPACSGGSSSCRAWQQFVYSTNCACAFIQYWLIDYASPCPAGWTTTATDCWKNSANAVAVPSQPLANLPQLTLTGTAVSGGSDTIVVGTPGGNLSAVNGENIIDLANGWTTSEFGVYGDGNGSAATFDAGATMAVRTSVDNGTANAPDCVLEGFTGETSNLDLITPCCPYGGNGSSLPAIVFWLSNSPGATSMCAGGTSVGDTHLTNFNSLYYDFQASGDFLLAAAGPGFVVQVRQKSAALTWPNASFNKAVALRLGRTEAGICLEPARLMVNGKRRTVADGSWLTLPDGVRVGHSGNAYLFTRPGGEQVRAEVNSPGYINVSVDLDHQPRTRVYGLLGNVNGNQTEDDLATRDRKVLSEPLSFQDLYHAYADSWRIAARESLLTKLCGDKDSEPGIPDKPFYAQHLDPKDRERARAVCLKAGVKDPSLLDACTLDTVVLGTEAAARVFARTRPPRHEVRPGESGRK